MIDLTRIMIAAHASQWPASLRVPIDAARLSLAASIGGPYDYRGG